MNPIQDMLTRLSQDIVLNGANGAIVPRIKLVRTGGITRGRLKESMQEQGGEEEVLAEDELKDEAKEKRLKA